MKSVCGLMLGYELLGNKDVREYFAIIDDALDEDLIIGDYREITVEIGYKGELKSFVIIHGFSPGDTLVFMLFDDCGQDR